LASNGIYTQSGAGKSALINATLEVDTAVRMLLTTLVLGVPGLIDRWLQNVSHEISGVSDINKEITSRQNTRFIMHDSQGFAAGETHNYATVQKFIADRAKEPKLKDRLHAIW
jgi:predicted GTPase